jgi:UDP-2,4-diacetamido-2,4,6-trideoxy-beta-L-altropyranose hydrolase
MTDSPRLVIRADANADMGTGHVMRMIALAQAWHDDGGDAVFLCAEITPALEQRIRDEKLQLEKFAVAPGTRDDLAATSAAVSRHAAAGRLITAAVDGYQFDADFQLGLRQTGCRLLVVDDYGHCDRYHADWVLNQNISACEELYSNRVIDTRLLLGSKFALLRREFVAYRATAHAVPDKARKLLVTMGGADADNVAKKVIDALAGTGLEIRVAVGGSNPHLSILREAAQEVSRGDTKVDLVVNKSDMSQLMSWADMAVAAGGSTSWELAYFGVPTVFVILASNQEQNVRELERLGFGISLGEHSQFEGFMLCDALNRLASDQELRTAFAARGREIVDGLGAKRVVSVLSNNKEIDFRPVMEEDLRLIWEWANDPATRANSFESAAIPWEQHRQWCESKMNNAQCNFWVASNRDCEQVGVVRFDHHDGEAMVSISVAPHARGRGYGTKIIKSACDQLFGSSAAKLVRALIKPGNDASIKAFGRAGFQRDISTTVKGQAAEQYLLHRSS